MDDDYNRLDIMGILSLYKYIHGIKNIRQLQESR